MQKKRYLLVLVPLLLCTYGAYGQVLSNGDDLFSPTASLTFYEMANELSNSGPDNKEISDSEAEQAMIFLAAASKLDRPANYIIADMLDIACKSKSVFSLPKSQSRGQIADVNDPNQVSEPKDNFEVVKALLIGYVKNNSDLQIAHKGIRYLLSKSDSREQKEQILSELLRQFNKKNDPISSELATTLGLLSSEKADYESASGYFLTAINKNRYNQLAFEKFYELAAEQITAATYLGHLRYQLGANPLDLQRALAFAGYAQQYELFQTAADAYEYCSKLFKYLYPDEPLPQYIYLPLALCSYNTERNPHVAMQIANDIRQTGTLDIMLEAVAAKAAMKTFDTKGANYLLASAESKALNRYTTAGAGRKAVAEQLGWFYCFGKVDPGSAIDWANKAYATEPNSATAAALLAYAFILNDEIDLARPFVESYQANQILNLVKSHIELADDKNDSAIETLKEIITSAPETLVAQKAREKLNELGSEYVPVAEPSLTRSVLEASFGSQILPLFLRPADILEVQLKTRGDKFSYGQNFEASLIITNRSGQDLIVSDNGLVQGNIRVDAEIRGDLNKTIANLVVKKVQPSEYIQPNSTLIVPIKLVTGRLKEIMQHYPQANLEIEFTTYLDPVILSDGSVGNRMEDIKPISTIINRPGLELTAQFLRNRMNSLKRRRQSHRTAELFAGLLIEERLMANREPLYEFMYADWMPNILKSGLVYNLSTDDWASRIHTMHAMLDLPLDFELVEAVSKNLNDEHWPVRMTALYLLARNQNDGFGKVLDHVTRYDRNKLVRDMAVALGGKKPTNQP